VARSLQKHRKTMSSTHARWVFFLSGVVCAVWLLAVHAFVNHLMHHWPSDSEVASETADPCARSAEASAEQTWKLRTQPSVPPITATTKPLREGHWGLELCGVHEHDMLFEMGFRDGDILVEVDGWRPSSPRAALASYGRILADEVSRVEVSRGRRLVTLHTTTTR
jgi:hypothetical protein